jgi:hypothetical protein
MARHVAHMGRKTNAYRALVGKPEAKRSCGRFRRRWEGTIKVDFK